MTANEKIGDLRALRIAVESQRESLRRLIGHKAYRKHRLRNVIRRIRDLRAAIVVAFSELAFIRGATNGQLAAKIEEHTARLRELDLAILHQEQIARIEKLLKLKRQIEELGLEMPAELVFSGDPDEIDEEIILS